MDHLNSTAAEAATAAMDCLMVHEPTSCVIHISFNQPYLRFFSIVIKEPDINPDADADQL